MAKPPAQPAPKPQVPFTKRPPAITILSDHAAQDRDQNAVGNDTVAFEADRDQFDLQARLASTFDILRHKNTRCPLAIAVYGDWGTGKTSAMRWLETRLREWNSVSSADRQGHPRAYPVWFDPWRYHNKEEVWRGIIAEVILALFRVGNLDSENMLPRMVQAVKKFGGFLGRSFIHAVANLDFHTSGKAKVPGLGEAGYEFSAKGEMFRDIWEEYDKTAHPHKAHLNQFEDTLRTWVTDFLGPQAEADQKPAGITREPARLVIFIDDLDRCMPEVALEVIEALKLYLNIDHLIFVVGLDESVVRAVVAEHYKKSGVGPEKSLRYLDKVFQVDLRIPPSEAAMADYMRTQIAALNTATGGYWHDIMDRSGYRETLEGVLIKLARNNPREVKRLLNSALLRGRAASLDEKLTLSAEDGLVSTPAVDYEAERFAQGVQVFLLQRLLADRLPHSDDLLTYSHHLSWFAKASEEVHAAFQASGQSWAQFQQHLPNLGDAEGELGIREMGIGAAAGSKMAELSKNCLEGLSRLQRHLTEDPPREETSLWTDGLFLWLLQVPFSQAVASHFPPVRSTVMVSATPTLWFETLPSILREHLASAANVPVTELLPEHLSQITSLNLSDKSISSSDLHFLTRLPCLTELNLKMCIGLRDTAALEGLHQLETLRISNCSGLKGSEAWQGLAGLKSLRLLELRSCPGLQDTAALAGLRQLEILNLSFCAGLKKASALQGLTGLESLRLLDLSHCTGLNSLMVRKVRKQIRPQCSITGPDGKKVMA